MTLSEKTQKQLFEAVAKSNGTLILASEADIKSGKIGGCKIDWKTACILPPESPSTTT